MITVDKSVVLKDERKILSISRTVHFRHEHFEKPSKLNKQAHPLIKF